MLPDIVKAFLWSISPFGESKVGIPYGMFNGENIYLVFIVCFLANMLVFPLMHVFLNNINKYLIRWNPYKKLALGIARKAKRSSGENIRKYGFYGLILFVMVPFPGTGVYAGSIVSYLFKMETNKAFMANAIGIFFSSLIVWVTTLLTMKGMN